MVFLSAAAFSGASCLRRPPPSEADISREVFDGPSLVRAVEARAAGLEKLEAQMEVKAKGVELARSARLVGALFAQRRGESSAGVIQLYTLLGAPALEARWKGPRVAVYAPLAQCAFVNFTGLYAAEETVEFPASSFNDSVFPLEQLLEFLNLLWGEGFYEDRDYRLTMDDTSYLLSEWREGELIRGLEFNRIDLTLTRAVEFQNGIPRAEMECDEYQPAGDGSFLFPRRVRLSREEAEVLVRFSGVRVNQAVKQERLEFKKYPAEKVYLLTPPLEPE